MTIHERIKKIRGDISQTDFAIKLGVSRSTILHYEKGDSSPNATFLNAVCDIFNISPAWILTGSGNMTGDRDLTGLGSEWTRVPLYHDRLAAGAGTFIVNGGGDDPCFFTFRTSWLNRKCQPKQCAVFHVSGDSMFPMIQDGDVVLVDMAQSNLQEVREGKIYAFSEGNLIRVKRLIYKGAGELWAISDNKQLSPDAPIEMSTFSLIGRVVWLGHEVW